MDAKTLKLQRCFVIYKKSPLKMQKIKKPRSPSRQLLETVNFAFMKIFDFLVKIALFRASLLFLGDSRHAFPPRSRVQMDPYCMMQISKKTEKCLKNGYFD